MKLSRGTLQYCAVQQYFNFYTAVVQCTSWIMIGCSWKFFSDRNHARFHFSSFVSHIALDLFTCNTTTIPEQTESHNTSISLRSVKCRTDLGPLKRPKNISDKRGSIDECKQRTRRIKENFSISLI